MKPLTILIAGILASGVLDALVRITQSGKRVILIRVLPAARATVSAITGLIVTCCTFGSLRITSSPSRWSSSRTGGFSSASVPRPRFPFSRRRRSLRPLSHNFGWPLCPATIYTSSASILPVSCTSFFRPQFIIIAKGINIVLER